MSDPGPSLVAPPGHAPLSLDVHLGTGERLQALRADVAAGLTATPKELPPKWFYDRRGSELFGAITRLPEYYLTRRERSILVERAGRIAEASSPTVLAELGSGTSEKTRILLDALCARGLRRFVAFDVDERTLRESASRVAAEYPALEVQGVVGDLDRHLHLLPLGGRSLVAFLGSSIGNFRPERRARFLGAVRAAMAPGDSLLLGLDLVKDPARLLAAYDDAAGVTAEFNRNVLRVVNRELGADFRPERFGHVVRWDAAHEWIEMRLRARERGRVSVRDLALEVQFEAGEELLTETSAKFRRDRAETELRSAGFLPAEWWTDGDGDFALSLSVAGQA
jgi:L-histidine Nalpha-methyltransferase